MFTTLNITFAVYLFYISIYGGVRVGRPIYSSPFVGPHLLSGGLCVGTNVFLHDNYDIMKNGRRRIVVVDNNC